MSHKLNAAKACKILLFHSKVKFGAFGGYRGHQRHINILIYIYIYEYIHIYVHRYMPYVLIQY